jgi:RimJ/RimL family protein N-acetyltransferase
VAEPAGFASLETDRLLLRPFSTGDVDNLVALDSDPAVMRFINGGRATPREDVVEHVLPRFLWYQARPDGYGFWAVEEKASGAFIGWFHLRPDPDGGDPEEPELGYRLLADFWGKGYATEGSRALIDWAFVHQGARRVWAAAMALNVGSWRVMEKAGMRHVRTFWGEWPEKIPGDEHGDVEYALTREEWEARTDSKSASRAAR